MANKPHPYNTEIIVELCEYLSEGMSLAKACSHEGMPSRKTVYRWLADDDKPEFRRMYATAKMECADKIVDEILEIADDATNDWMEKNGSTVLNSEHVQRSRVRIDARKWIAGKLKPKSYGDIVQLPEEPIKHVFTFKRASDSEND